MTKCDIIIVTYNSSNKILDLLLSLEKNSDFLNSVFILENNSPDKHITEKIIKSYLKKKSTSYNIFFKKMSKNFGFAYSCNKGAKLTSSQYILFLNPDTKLEENSLKLLIKHAIHKNADIVGGLVVSYTGKIHRTAVRKPDITVGLFEFTNLGKLLNTSIGTEKFYIQQNKTYKEDILVDAVSGAYMLVKREAFRKLHGFDENFFMYLEDVDLGVRANNLGMKVLFCPHSKIFHEGGASSKNKHKIKHSAWFHARKYFYKKHYGVFINLIVQPIFTVEEFLLKIRSIHA